MVIESKIDEVMQKKGITVDQLIERTGLTRMTIYNARKGLNTTLKTALKISSALESSIEEVFIGEPDKEDDDADLLAS